MADPPLPQEQQHGGPYGLAALFGSPQARTDVPQMTVVQQERKGALSYNHTQPRAINIHQQRRSSGPHASNGYFDSTPDNGKRRIVTQVAPSGSSKTKARREKEAAEKRRKLSEATRKAVLAAGGDLEMLEKEGLLSFGGDCKSSTDGPALEKSHHPFFRDARSLEPLPLFQAGVDIQKPDNANSGQSGVQRAIIPQMANSTWETHQRSTSKQSMVSDGNPFQRKSSVTTPSRRNPPTPPPLPFQDDPRTSHNSISVFVRDSSSSASWISQNEYTYLPLRPDQVRLLCLEKGSTFDPIHCSLKTVPTEKLKGDELDAYQALSYAWGTDDALHEVFLYDQELAADGRSLATFYRLAMNQAKPRRFYVRPNLFAALTSLRSETTDLWFWIDAICINQQDDIEKSHQLTKMLDIYSYAFNVCIWIGAFDDFCDGVHPIDSIPNIVNLRTLDRLLRNDHLVEKMERREKAEKLVAFAKLLQRPWFQRRWVIQEVAASRQASVQCGDKNINWIDFADAIELFLTNLDQLEVIYGDTALEVGDLDAFRYARTNDARAIVTTTNNVLRKLESGAILDRLLNIESLVMKFSRFEASDPRDTIYALLSLASDGHLSGEDGTSGTIPPQLLSDYTKSTLQVYVDFVRHCIASSQSLDIICRDWALELPLEERGHNSGRPGRLTTLPSWIGRIQYSSSPAFRAITSVRESFVGEPGRRIYNASRGWTPRVRFDDANVRDNMPSAMAPNSNGRPQDQGRADIPPVLYTEGILLGGVTRLSNRIVDGIIPDDCLAMAGWDAITNDVNSLSDQIWRTLSADRDSNGGNAPCWYRRAMQYCLRRTSPDGDLNTKTLIGDKSLPETVIGYLKRMQNVVWNRRILVYQPTASASDSCVGLGPREIKEGDLVCILFGCSVPVVLRRNIEHDGTQWYSFIGECYVHGKMEGEALAGADKQAIQDATVEFNIR